MSERKTGRTSSQLLAASQGAIFISPTNSHRDYVATLAAHLGRSDIHVITRHNIAGYCRRAKRHFTEIIQDHSMLEVPCLRLRHSQAQQLIEARAYARAAKEAASMHCFFELLEVYELTKDCGNADD